MKLAYLAFLALSCAPAAESKPATNWCSQSMLPPMGDVPPGTLAVDHKGWPVVALICSQGKWRALTVMDVHDTFGKQFE